MRHAVVAIAALALAVLGACSQQRTVSSRDTQREGPATPEPISTPETPESPAPSQAASPTASPRPAVPTLKIGSPESGETVSIPLEVRYQIAGFDVGPSKGHVHVEYGKGAKEFAEMPVSAASGSAVVEGLPEGTYDLVFVLVRADHSRAGPRATVKGVTLITRGAGGGGPGGY